MGIFYALPAFQLVFSEQRVSVTLESSSDHLVCCALEHVYLERERESTEDVVNVYGSSRFSIVHPTAFEL